MHTTQLPVRILPLLGLSACALLAGCNQPSQAQNSAIGLVVSSAPIDSPLAGVPTKAIGVNLLPADPLEKFLPEQKEVQTKIAPVTGQKFARALQTQTSAQPTNAWDFQIGARTVASVKKGDVLLATFWMRAVQTQAGYGRTEVVFEDATSYNKSVTFGVAASPVWKQFAVPFVASQDEPTSEGVLHFRLGFLPQTIQLADIRLINYGNSVALSDLPKTEITYEGRALDAPWRKDAAARIDKYRKGDLSIRVLDAQGKAIPNARVQVTMTRHAFHFGAAMDLPLLGDSADAQKYRQVARDNFNVGVPGRELKSWEWEKSGESGGYGRAVGLKAVKTMRDLGLEVRGHNLVWPSWQWMGQLQPLAKTPPVLAKHLTDHITDEVTALKGQCFEWDVINEPYNNHDIMDILGNHAMVDWFKTARAADPDARLYVNDFGITESNGEDVAHINGYEKTIKYLIDNGAPLGGIGLQSHFSQVLTSPATAYKIIDRFAKFKLPLAVTEFDVNVEDEQLQADYLRDYLTITFSHPAIREFVMWGFWEGDHWIPDAAMYRKDWTMKPNGKMWRDLVYGQWWTRAKGVTSATGDYKVRGFQGDYLVTVQANGHTKTVRTSIPAAGRNLQIVVN